MERKRLPCPELFILDPCGRSPGNSRNMHDRCRYVDSCDNSATSECFTKSTICANIVLQLSAHPRYTKMTQKNKTTTTATKSNHKTDINMLLNRS